MDLDKLNQPGDDDKMGNPCISPFTRMCTFNETAIIAIPISVNW